jgi:peptide/nickel transport system substrate-binding protein
VVDYASAPATLDPVAVDEEVSFSILGNVYEPLVELGAGLAAGPGLADRWYDEDGGRTWVFKLRSGVLFHDGHELTARDVTDAYERGRATSGRLRGILARVDRFEAPDDRTLVARARVPVLDLPYLLCGVFVWRPAASAGEPPLGTGPYRIVRRERDGTAVLAAFPRYRQPIAVRGLEFHVVPDETERVARLARGQSHVLADVPADALGKLAAHPQLRIQAAKGLRIVFLGMATRGGLAPLGDVRVRRAVALALDRAALVAGPLGGLAQTSDLIVSPPVVGGDANLPPLPHDPAEARRLLAAADLSRGLDVNLEFMPAKYRAMPAVARAVAEDLAKVGIRATLRPLAVAEFLDRRRAGSGQLFLQGWLTTHWDAGVTYEQLLHTKNGGRGSENGTGYSDPNVDGMIDRALAEMRPEPRVQLYHALARRLQVDLPLVPLYRQDDLYVLARDLDFEPTVTRHIRGIRMRWRR